MLPYQLIDVNGPDGTSRTAEYLSINPTGKVPLLVDGDVSMCESYAINLFLARQYGHAGLWPTSRVGQAAGLQWSFWVATETEPQIATLYQQLFQRTDESRDAQALDRARNILATALSSLDRALAGQSNLGGDDFSIADLNVACGLRNAHKLHVDLTPFEHVDRWLSTSLARPAHTRVIAMSSVGT